jgi:hypothetical protein
VPRQVAVVGFLAASAAAGGAWGALVRALWDLLREARWSRPPSGGGALDALLRVLADWLDALPIAGGMLLVVALYRLLRSADAQGRQRGWRWRGEMATWLALAAAALIWSSPHARGATLWAGAAVQTGAARVCLLALQLGAGVACRIGRAAARRLVPACGEMLLYLAGRGGFILAFMKGLRLQGENAMYLIVPAAAGVAEAILLLLCAGACLVVARRSGSRQDPDGREPEPPPSVAASGRSS